MFACAEAYAQEPAAALAAASSAPRVEVTGLVGVFGGASLGETDAVLLTNGVPAGGHSTLFTTRTDVTTAAMVEGRVGVRAFGNVWVEGGASYARPDLAVEIAGDVEGAPDVTATSRLTQIVADVGLQYRWRGRRLQPFAAAGGGYLRQLDEPRTTAETGSVLYAGGGAVVRLAPDGRGVMRRLALRGDVRLVWLRGGIDLDEGRTPALVAAGGLSIAF